MTPKEYETKREQLEKERNDDIRQIGQKYDIKGNISIKEKENDAENVKKARFECLKCNEKHALNEQSLTTEFQKSFDEIITDSKNNKQEAERLQSLIKQKGDKKMEPKDEKEIENIIVKVLDKHNKNSQFEKTINDIHSKISKIDSIEGKLVDIIPKVGKIDSICEDGKCFKTELSDIKKDLAETKKGKISTDICPECGEPAIIHSDTFYASHCANCGEPVPEWTGDDGVPIAGWKNYKLRGK